MNKKALKVAIEVYLKPSFDYYKHLYPDFPNDYEGGFCSFHANKIMSIFEEIENATPEEINELLKIEEFLVDEYEN